MSSFSSFGINRNSWPWVEENHGTWETKNWPKITVITPSFNQGRFIEQTIRSVVMQGYPNLEYMIFDGGSTDQTIEIIRKYEHHTTHWESEPDRGQSHAINKGLARATGDILCWLNSDDYYLPDTLRAVAEALAEGRGNVALVGHCIQVYDDGRPPVEGKGRFEGIDRLLQFWKGYHMHQPSIFWRREVFDRVGYLDESLHMTMDFDYWVRIAQQFDFTNLDRPLSYSTYHADAKTGDDFARYYEELRRRAPRYWSREPLVTYYRMKFSMYVYMVVWPRIKRMRALASYYPRRAWALLFEKFRASA